MASWARLRRNPYQHGWKSASKMGSSTSLHDPIGDGRDTQPAELAVRLWDRHLPHRIRPEYPLLELLSEPLKQSGRLHRTKRPRRDPIGTGRTRTLVRPHPLPRDG